MKNQAISGAKWTTLSMVLTTSAQMTQMLVLARLLPPETFGLLAILMLIVGFADLQTQLGLNQVIIQEKSLTQIQSSSLYWFAIMASVAMYLGCNTIYLVGQGWLFDKGVGPLLAVITLSFIINALGGQFGAYLQKSLNFKAMALAEIIGAISGTTLAILLVHYGFGIWALVVGFLVRCTTLSILLIIFAHKDGTRITKQFSLSAIKPQIAFSLHLFGGNLLSFANTRVDQLIIATLLGQQALGYYAMAFNVVIQPILRLTPIISRVALPILSKLRDSRDDLANGYCNTLSIQAYINTPVFIGLAVIAPTFIPFLLGTQWDQTALIIQWLCLFAYGYCISFNGTSFLIASGKSKKVLQWNMGVAVITPISVTLGAVLNGSIGAAIALALTHLILILAWYRFMVKPIINLPMIKFYTPLLTPLIPGVAMATAVQFVHSILTEPGLSKLALITLLILTGILVYGLLTALMFRLKHYLAVPQK